ncbi:Hypothetical predicted protein, partial [Paramuricea clavata]
MEFSGLYGHKSRTSILQMTWLSCPTHPQQQMQEKINDVATTSAQLGLNIYRGKIKVLKVNADNTHPIKLEEQVLEEVEAFTYLGSVDADRYFKSKNRQGKSSVCATKEHLEFKGTVPEDQNSTVQHQRQ